MGQNFGFVKVAAAIPRVEIADCIYNEREIYNQIEYVKKCIPVYPLQYYKFISSQRYSDIDGVNMVDDEIVEILLEIYKKLSQDENEDAMNEILDLFDEYIYRDNRVLKNAVSLLS